MVSTAHPQALLQELARGAVTERLMESLVVVEFEVGGDAVARLRHVVVGLEVGEWRRGISPLRSRRTERESRDSFGSHHPTAGSEPLQCANRLGLRRLSERHHAQTACVWPRNLLYLRTAHRTMKASIVRSSARSFEG
jgi:hypothetical protein